MEYNLIKDELGYYSITPKPSKEDLNNFYSQKYYQNNLGHYSNVYSDKELMYFEMYSSIIETLIEKYNYKDVIDVGCGEGFLISYLKKKKYNVTGLDFSKDGLKQNPNIENDVIVGDIYDNINKLFKNNKKYDLVILNNVLEHVIDPKDLLINIKKIINKDGILIIKVPNDFSKLQKYLYNNKYVEKKFWVYPPEHLSYFSYDSLRNIINKYNYKEVDCICDFPIDFDLLQKSSNYINEKSLGKQSHERRLEINNFLYKEVDINLIIDYFRSIAKMKCGRNIIMLVTPN